MHYLHTMSRLALALVYLFSVGYVISLPDVELVDECSLEFPAIALVDNIVVDFPDAKGFQDTTRYKRGSGKDGTIVYNRPNGFKHIAIRGSAMEGTSWAAILLAGDINDLKPVINITSDDLKPSDYTSGWALLSLQQRFTNCPTHAAIKLTGQYSVCHCTRARCDQAYNYATTVRIADLHLLRPSQHAACVAHILMRWTYTGHCIVTLTAL